MSHARKLDKICEGIRNGAYKNIVVLTGAGISVASGIPDFRSPGGLYKTLNPSLLTATEAQRDYLRRHPMGVVDIDLFRVNQLPYLEVRRPFILGTAENTWKPTIAHAFVNLLDDRGCLLRVYDQNIDGLYHSLGLRWPKLVKLHGSLAEAACEFCGAAYPFHEFCDAVRTKIRNIYDAEDAAAPTTSSSISCPRCGKPGVKPSTVLFGTDLNPHVVKTLNIDFQQKREDIDLLLISGSSLMVSPACTMVSQVGPSVPRILVNNEQVGSNVGLNFDDDDGRDIWINSSCDRGFLELSTKLGWNDQLRRYKDLLCESSRIILVSPG
jgi:NAD-dependent deacetylase sirtuin 2